jgi:hypothetical protein
VKLCKDCRHYRLTFWQRIRGRKPLCDLTKVMSPVDGKVEYISFCRSERMEGCGRDAKNFEPRHGLRALMDDPSPSWYWVVTKTKRTRKKRANGR